MDRNIVYPSSIPLDTDLLSLNRNVMVALGYLIQSVMGQNTVVDGLSCLPTVPPSLTVSVGPGSIVQPSVIDTLAYGSLPADVTDPLLKMGINTTATEFTLVAPTSSGDAVNYLIEASFQESDINPVVLPYYNASNPAQPYSGPANAGTSQNTLRSQKVALQLKPGAPALAGTQLTPPVDPGWVGLYVITVSYGQTAITATNISSLPGAPFLNWKLPSLVPGFGAGVESFVTSGTFTVPNGITQVEVEVWGGGSGSFASTASIASGGGSGGGYARKLVSGLTPGQTVAVTVGIGGAGGTTAGTAASPGGSSSFGTFVSATGGSVNATASISQPQNGATPGGSGIGGDVNLTGSSGQSAFMSAAGVGGAAPLGGMQSSGTVGVAGVFPGGGAGGAGTGVNGTTPYNGAAGANGFVVVRW
ncbi:MAG: glycine-rich domain-containing protein [Acetobacteraceae bacterium]